MQLRSEPLHLRQVFVKDCLIAGQHMRANAKKKKKSKLQKIFPKNANIQHRVCLKRQPVDSSDQLQQIVVKVISANRKTVLTQCYS